MSVLVNFITDRLSLVNLSHPLIVVDLIVAIFLVILFLAYLRRFPVYRVVLGLLLLFACSGVFYLLGLLFTALLFSTATSLILISLPLIFAPEIRHYLQKLGRFPFLKIPSITSQQKKHQLIRNLADSVYEMAERKIGGTIVLARQTGLGETIDTGVIIDARFSSKLLQNLFYPKSPLHDGAVIIRDDRIYAAGCLLPIRGDISLDPPFGTRHKSGLAITTDTDAVVVVISEQRGEVTLAENGKLDINIDKIRLLERLQKLI